MSGWHLALRPLHQSECDLSREYPALAQRQLGLAPAKITCDTIKGIKRLQWMDGDLQ